MGKYNKNIKKLMYGTCNIERLVEDNGYIVDKTHFIEKIEQHDSKHLIFYRPRLFGKSAFLSLLRYYYDMREKSKFEKIFGNLYIGKNPTPLRNSYPILHLDVGGQRGDVPLKDVEGHYHLHLKLNLRTFFWQYPELSGGLEVYEKEFDILQDGNEALALFFKKFEALNTKIYLIIEDYDTLPNHMVTHYSMENYRKITGSDGFFRKTFDLIRAVIASGVVERSFGIGLMPQVMDDLTDGESPFVSISRSPEFYDMGGFTEDDVIELVDYYIQNDWISKDIKSLVLSTMKSYYSGFLFSPDPTKAMYNPMSVFNFISYYQTESVEVQNKLPFSFNLFDSNLRSDFDRIRLFTLDEDRSLNINFNALLEALLNGQFKGKLLEVFGNGRTDPNWFMSFLYYRGFMTVKTEENGDDLFSVPNKVCSKYLWDYLDSIIRDAFRVFRTNNEYYKLNDGMWDEHIWQPLFEVVLKVLYEKVDIKYFIQRNISVLEILCHCFNIWYMFEASPQQNINGETIGIHLIANNKSVYISHYLVQIKCLKDSELSEKEKVKQIEEFKKSSHKQLKHAAQDPKFTDKPVKLITIVLGENEALLIK
jgi:hypothetical protein